jgi:hypothetical protein
LVKVEAAGQFAGNSSIISSKLESGKACIVAAQLGDTAVQADTDVAVLHFKALNTLGSVSIKLDQSSTTAFADADVTGKLYPLTADIIKTLTITRSIVEDVDDNGRVDMIDVIKVAKQIGATINDDIRAMDINGDNGIDVVDVALVILKIFNSK